MFGSNNNQTQNSDNQQTAGAPAPAPADNNGISSFTMDPPHPDDAANPALPPEPTASLTDDASTAPHLDEPAIKPHDGPMIGENNNLPPAQEPISSDSGSGTSNDDLISIKQQALSQLSPLVGHLDQSPEDKFKTLMMMIQANDNQALIKEAYAAAQEIPDEKAKSQALLDVVNEINYFTHKTDDK